MGLHVIAVVPQEVHRVPAATGEPSEVDWPLVDAVHSVEAQHQAQVRGVELPEVQVAAGPVAGAVDDRRTPRRREARGLPRGRVGCYNALGAGQLLLAEEEVLREAVPPAEDRLLFLYEVEALADRHPILGGLVVFEQRLALPECDSSDFPCHVSIQPLFRAHDIDPFHLHRVGIGAEAHSDLQFPFYAERNVSQLHHSFVDEGQYPAIVLF